MPVFAEVDDTLTLDPADVAAKMTERTGPSCPSTSRTSRRDMDALTVTDAAGIAMLEDAAQSMGVTYHGRATGTIGALGAARCRRRRTSRPARAGIVLTDDEDHYVHAARYHDQGGQFVTQYRGSAVRIGENRSWATTCA